MKTILKYIGLSLLFYCLVIDVSPVLAEKVCLKLKTRTTRSGRLKSKFFKEIVADNAECPKGYQPLLETATVSGLTGPETRPTGK